MRNAIWIALLKADLAKSAKAAAKAIDRESKAARSAADEVANTLNEAAYAFAPDEAEFRAWVAAWQADGHPTRLGFAARYTARKAALLLKRGHRPAEIRLELWSRALAVCEHFDSGVKGMFLEIIRRRLDDVLGPIPEAPSQENTR